MTRSHSRRRLGSARSGINPVLDQLEPRRLLAAPVVYVNDNWAIFTDLAPPGLSAGDIVQDIPAGIIGKTFGTDAFATIASAIAGASAGGTVNLLPGTYPESDIAVTKPLTIDGDPAGADRALARVVPAVASDRTGRLFAAGVHSAFILRSANVTIQDLTIDGDAGVGGADSRNYRGGIVYDYTPGIAYNNITIANNAITNTYDLGIYLDGGINARSSGHSVAGNSISRVRGGARASGIHLIQASASVTANSITSCAVGISTNSVDGLPFAPTATIQGNTILSTPTAMHLASLAEGSLVGGPLAAQRNTITLTGGSNGIGILLDYAVGQVTIQNNRIDGTGTDSALWLFDSGTPAKPVLVKDNHFSSYASPIGQGGQSTGIFITDDALLFGISQDAPSHATITGNLITGFARAVDLYRVGDRVPVGAQLAATIGGPDPADGNTFVGNGGKNTAGIRVFDNNGTAPANAVATFVNGHNSIGNFDVSIYADGGTATVSENANIGPAMSITATNFASVNLLDSQYLLRINVTHSAKVAVAPGGDKTLVLSYLSIESNGCLDLADNDLIIGSSLDRRDGVLSAVAGYIALARRNGWQDVGLTSSAARTRPFTTLATIINDKGDHATPVRTVFDGHTPSVDAVLVKYTWDGDANLDGVVNADDYFQIDGGYISQEGGYYNGDFNYDFVVNADDYFLIDSSYIGQSGPLSASPRLRVFVSSPSAVVSPVAAEATLLQQLFSTEPVL